MKKHLVFLFWTLGLPAYSQSFDAAERLRITNDRTLIETASALDDSACYKLFFVNSCLDKVRLKRVEALADLRRQETLLDDQERKARGAEQVKKTEDKEAAQRQPQVASKRSEELKNTVEQAPQPQQKRPSQAKARINEKGNRDAAKSRLKKAEQKLLGRQEKQAAQAQSARLYQQRQERAIERSAKLAQDKARQTKPLSAPLPIPN